MATDGPVLADLWSSLIARGRSPVFSVTSELAASVSFQAAPRKPARNDPSQPNDSFGALVDSNTAAGDTASTSATAQQPQPQPAAPRRADDAAPGADNTPSRDTTSANQPAQNAPNGGNASTNQAAANPAPVQQP